MKDADQDVGPRWDAFLFCALLILLVAPVWSFKYLPTSDGPAHLYNAICLRDYFLPDRAPIRAFLALNIHPYPNWVASALLLGFCCVFPPLIAEKLFLTLYLASFMLALRYLLASIDPKRTSLAIVGAPFAANFYFHMGFYNFCYSLVIYFVVVGYWIRQERRPAFHKSLLLAALLLLLYFAHLVPLVLAGLFIAMMLIWRVAGTRNAGVLEQRAAWKSIARNTIAMLPASLAGLHYMLAKHSTRMNGPEPLHPHAWYYRLRNLLSWMKSFQNFELGPAALQMALFAGVTLWLLLRRKGKLRRNDAYLLITAIYLLVFLAAPTAMAGGSMIVVRLACFPFFTLLLWFASEPLERLARQRMDTLTVGVSLIVFIALLLSHFRSYARINAYLQEFADAESHIPGGATLLPIPYADGGDLDQQGRRLSIGATPLFEAADYFAAERGIVTLDNYEASVDYFPLVYRPEVDPFVQIMDRNWDFENYRTPSGQRIDYVLLWTGGVERNDPTALSIDHQLKTHYDLIFTSAYSGDARLYRNRNRD